MKREEVMVFFLVSAQILHEIRVMFEKPRLVKIRDQRLETRKSKTVLDAGKNSESSVSS
jgi:hypothetical protein